MSSNSAENWNISWVAIFKVVTAIALCLLLTKVYTLGLLILLGLFLAISLNPTVKKFQGFGISRSLAIAIVGILMTGFVGGLIYIIVPSIFGQVTSFVQSLPQFKESLLNHLSGNTAFHDFAQDAIRSPKIPSTDVLMDKVTAMVTLVVEAVSEFFLVLIFSIYFLVDGDRAYHWISDFFSAPVRLKIEATSREATHVVHGYVAGQVITCIGSGIFLYALLLFLKVPAALTLAAIAGVMDLVPLLGFLLAVIPATLLGLTVSPLTGITVLIGYGLYHACETYVLAPWIYGKRMKVSSLVVLIALLVAGTVGGILAAITILPIVASYPIIERIWLIKYLGKHVVSKHADISGSAALESQVKLWGDRFLDFKVSEEGLAKNERINFGKNILIIDDNVDVRSMLKEILDTEGYSTHAAANGKEGFAMLRQQRGIGLILLDITMPIMDGRQFLEELKSDSKFKNIPVVLLSASINQTDVDGAAGILRKPAELQEVLFTVEKYYAQNI